MKRLSISILFILTVGSLYAQSNLIIGKVADAQSGKPMKDVVVYWDNNKDKSVRTDLYGIYKIPSISTERFLVFEYPGKKKLTLEVKDSNLGEVDAFLEESGTTAITASRWEQSIYEIPASVVIISREEIEKNGYITLQEILENLAGVFTIDHRSESDVTIGIRGFWGPFNRNVMIQVNGVNMLSERQNDFPLNKINVPVEAIDKIEVVRGPMSVIYGAGASFGVINIITNQADPDTDGIVSTSFGSQNGQRNFVRYAVNNQGLRLSFNASTWRRDGFDENWDDYTTLLGYQADEANNLANGRVGARTISAYRGMKVGAERYSRRHESINLSVGYGGFSGNINYATSNFGFSFLHPGPDTRNDYRSNTLNAQFGYRKPLDGGNFDYEVKLSAMNSIVDATYKYYFEDSRPFGQDRVTSLRLEANGRYVISDSDAGANFDLDLIAGLWYSGNLENNSKYDAPETGLINWFLGLAEGEALNTNAGYAQLNYKKEIGKGILNIVGGGRFEQQESYRVAYNAQRLSANSGATSDNLDQFSVLDETIPATPLSLIPRFAIIYTPQEASDNRRLYMKGMYGQAINQVGAALNASQANTFSQVGGDQNLNVQPFLGPEKIETIEFGFTYVNDDSNYEINLNLFRNDLKDLVTRKVSSASAGGFRTIRENGGELETHGIELIFKKSAQEKYFLGKRVDLNTSLDISYQETEITNAAELIREDILAQQSFDPSFSPNLLGNLILTASMKKLSLGAQLNYVGSMEPYLLITNREPEFIGATADDYMRLGINLRLRDLVLNRKLVNPTGGLYFNLRISNFLNTQYRYPTYTINPWADRGMLGRARQTLLTVGFKF